MIHFEDFTFNSFLTRCSVVWDEEGNCAIIDPGCSSPKELGILTGAIEKNGLKPICIMLTHGHFDHILGTAAVAKQYSGLPVYMHPAEKFTLENNEYFCRCFGVPMPEAFNTIDIKEGDMIEAGSLRFEVIETPGHTKGGVSYLERSEKMLFSGDTLFAGAIGRTDHPGGDYDMIMERIFTKLLHLEGETKVIPGHGPCSDIATERMTNPFLLPFNEPYEE